MASHLRNRHLEFELDERGVWCLRSGEEDGGLALVGSLGAEWRAGSDRKSWTGVFPNAAAARREEINTPAGPAPGLTVDLVAPGSHVAVHLEFALPEEVPCLLWRARLRVGEGPSIRLGCVDLLNARGEGEAPRKAERRGLAGLLEPAAFITGWQSFGFAGSLGRKDRYPRTRLGPLLGPSREQPGVRAPRAAGRFLSEMFAVVGDRTRRSGLLLGALTAKEAFSSLDIDLRVSPVGLRLWCHGDEVTLAPGGTFTTDWAFAQIVSIDEPDPLGVYLDLAARASGGRTQRGNGAGITGWCSWYRLFRNIDEASLLENLSWLREHRAHLPLGLFVVDDGYEQSVGDWYPPWPRFPSGLPSVARRAREAGFVPGLWMAPFVAEPSSRTAKDHPDWILRRQNGRPVTIGLLGDVLPYALDSTHPGVLQHLESLVHTAVAEWGFGALKLDFLYAAALQGRRFDPGRTRAQAFRGALAQLGQAAGEECWILGCGCPLGAAIGLVDSMRVSPDVAPHWHPHYRGLHILMQDEATVPGTRNSLRNSINLGALHKRWWVNDPDCVLLQPEASGWGDAAPMPRGTVSRSGGDRWRFPRRLTRALGLMPHEVRTLLTLNSLVGGALLDSDHLPEVQSDRVEWLARFLPPLNERARAVDWFDSAYPSVLSLPLEGAAGQWWLVAMVNWSERPSRIAANLRQLGLPSSDEYLGVDLWGERFLRLREERFDSPMLPAHGIFFASVRPSGAEAAWLGDTLHVSAGSAVRSLQVGDGSFRANLELPHVTRGIAWLRLPAEPVSAMLNGTPMPFEKVDEAVYAFRMVWEGSANLDVHWTSSQAGFAAADSRSAPAIGQAGSRP